MQESLLFLKNKPIWKEHYQKFQTNMVYDSSRIIEYEKAVAAIEEISAKVIDSL